MRRLLVTLLLAHVIGSYALVMGLMTQWGVPRAEIWLLAAVYSPPLMGELTSGVLKYGRQSKQAATADVSYALGVATVITWRVVEYRRSRRSRRRRQGLCVECGYDLTGNVSGRCPECGAHVVSKARLMVRREP